MSPKVVIRGKTVPVEITYTDWMLLLSLIRAEAKRQGYHTGYTEHSQFNSKLKRLLTVARKLQVARFPEPLVDIFDKIDFSKYGS